MSSSSRPPLSPTAKNQQFRSGLDTRSDIYNLSPSLASTRSDLYSVSTASTASPSTYSGGGADDYTTFSGMDPPLSSDTPIFDFPPSLQHPNSAHQPAVPLAEHQYPSEASVGSAPGGRESSSVLSDANKATLYKVLLEQGYSQGLVNSLLVNKRAFAQAIWVVDNSGSMQTMDGHRMIVMSSSSGGKKNNNGGTIKFVPCSRWTELQLAVDYHAQMAALQRSPTTFRLLNDPGCVCGPQVFSIGVESGMDPSIGPEAGMMLDQELSIAVSTMQNAQPGGVTPLTEHIYAIRDHVASMQPYLVQNGTKVAVIIATDGLPSDTQGYSNDMVKRDFVSALRALGALNVWIVVRLCTDEDDVVQYWNELDSQLEFSLEVLDDFESEGKEVYATNPWLTYGLPLHRMREMGFHHVLLDLLDERPLSLDEVQSLLRILSGTFEAPDPQADWKGFATAIEYLLAREPKQWNPVLKKMTPWIDVKQLQKVYQNGNGRSFRFWK